METTMTHDLTYEMLAKEWFPGSGSTGTATETRLLGTARRNPQFDLLKGGRPRISWTAWHSIPEFADSGQLKAGWPCSYGTSPDITAESADNEQIFDAIRSLYLSANKPRDRQIAARIIALYRDALAEDERILSASLRQFTKFFLSHLDLGLPRITLTPNGTLRVRWIQGAGNFVAIEFTGRPLVQLVAEIPREGGETARYFSDDLIDDIVSSACALGASFT